MGRLIDELVATSTNLSEIRTGLLGCLKGDSTKSDAPFDLAQLSFSDLLVAYVSWVDGAIAQRPREVSIWHGFWSTGGAQEYKDDIWKLAGLIERGEDLSPFVSHRPYPHKDRALNAYDVHHLHFVPATGPRRRGRSDALLYVRVEWNKAHLVLCGDHRSFNDGTLRQAVADLDVARGKHFRGVESISPSLSAMEGEDLLRRGANSALKSGDRWAFPSLLSSAGTSIHAVQHTDRMVMAIEDWEPLMRTEQGCTTLRGHFGVEQDAHGTFGWGMDHASLYLVDVKAKRSIGSVSWRR